MKKFEIRIEQLDPMRVVVFGRYSNQPELEGHHLAVALTKAKGLVDADNHVKTYEFNKFAPWITSGDEYGYEPWVVVEDELDVPPYLRVEDLVGYNMGTT